MCADCTVAVFTGFLRVLVSSLIFLFSIVLPDGLTANMVAVEVVNMSGDYVKLLRFVQSRVCTHRPLIPGLHIDEWLYFSTE